jgi:hypothetical protein
LIVGKVANGRYSRSTGISEAWRSGWSDLSQHPQLQVDTLVDKNESISQVPRLSRFVSNTLSSFHSSFLMNLLQTSTLYWSLATALGVWFLFLHAPAVLKGRNIRHDPLFLCHLLGAYSIYLACMHNALFTPFLGPFIRLCHIWIGRCGFILGIIGFVTGFILTWTRVGMTNPAFSFGITFGGFAQIFSQYRGYQAIQQYRIVCQKQLEQEQSTQQSDRLLQRSTIQKYNTLTSDRQQLLVPHDAVISLQEQREKAVSEHILYMIPLFVQACGIPAIIRLSENIGDNVSILFMGIALLNIVSIFYSKSIMATRKSKQTSVDSTMIQSPVTK